MSEGRSISAYALWCRCRWYRRAVLALAVTLASAGGVSAAAAAAGGVRMWEGAGCGRRLEYSLDTCVLLNEAARRDQEVGWRLQGVLAVTATGHAAATDEALLRFELPELSVQARGAAPTAEWVARPSEWDAGARRAAAFAHWRAGRVLAVYLPAADPPAFANYKRALISLFQFQILDGERNETDASGECAAVRYETLGPLEFRKIKSTCVWADGSDEAVAGVYGGAGGGVLTRRVTRYSLQAHGAGADGAAVGAVFAEESIRAGERAGAGAKARAWARLTLRPAAPGTANERCLADGPGLPAALRQLPPGLRNTTLQLDPTPEPEEAVDEEAPLSAEEAIQLLAAAEAEAVGEGGPMDAVQLLRVYAALRAAPPAALLDALQRLPDVTALTGAARGLGVAGSAGALEAAERALQLRADPLQPAAAAFLAAFAAAPQADPHAIKGVMSLSTESRCARVRAGALLGAAGAAGRAGGASAAALRDHIAKQLARCKSVECRALHVTALGSLRRGDTAELLLEQTAAGGAAAAAAVRALGGGPRAALPPARVQRLLAVATNGSYPFALRAAALDLAVQRSAEMPAALVGAARRLHEEGAGRGRGAAHELQRVLYQRLEALAEAEGEREGEGRVGELLRALRRDPQLGSWDARALAGTSSVLRRDTGWGAWGAEGAWGAALDSAQLAAGGVLRRGTVTLLGLDRTAHTAHTAPLLQVELWTRGLSALTGSEGGPGVAGEEGEEAAAGLELAVGGAALPAIALFESQTELLGHVWAGRGSEPTSVVRALLPLGGGGAGAVPLGAGGVRVWVRGEQAAAAALAAHASVSLWARTAAARLALRAQAAARTRLVAATSYARAALTVTARAPVELHIAADLDFYDVVALCVRAHSPPHRLERNATLVSVTGARRFTVRRRRHGATPRPGRTLALGRLNDRTCRTLAATEH